ncbi:hypothetical protein HK096_004058 [Nowakowskiella sp. JEL0078]|nr:hypothetical protein HK096_004058 [Nowakowskiella sp. JEL0078]
MTKRSSTREKLIFSILENGVDLCGDVYHFFGCSNSQLKEQKAFLIKKKPEEVEALLQSMAKRTKRIGLLFSACEIVYNLDPKHTIDIDDLTSISISVRFAKILSKSAKIMFRQEHYLPSVYQIRYHGYKGVLSLDVNLNSHAAAFRKSMKKFSALPNSDNSFGIVQCSKPYTFGALNAEHVTLLTELGISKETLIKKQAEYFAFHESAITDAEVAFQLFAFRNQFDLIEKLTDLGISSVQSDLRAAQKDEISKSLDKRSERKVRFILPQSRLLFGIAEPSSELLADEVFVRITVNGIPHTLSSGYVIVTRNPCLHPGDFRKLKVVDVKEYHHLVDCIVFSTSSQLQRSAASEMAGGDLDGDQFMVIYDKDLITTIIFEPYKYPPAKLKTDSKISRNDILKHFASYNNYSMGKVKNLYLAWVAAKGASSKEATELNALFSSSVDGEPIKIPDYLKILPTVTPDQNFILDVLKQEAEKEILKLQMSRKINIGNIDSKKFSFSTEDTVRFLETVVFGSCSENVSDFENLCLIHRTIGQIKKLSAKDFELFKPRIVNLILNIDFCSLTFAQRKWACREYPEYTDSISNAVNQSKIFFKNEINLFQINNIGNWKRLYTISIESPHCNQRFIDAMTKFSRKLILIQASDRLSLGIFISDQIISGLNTLSEFHLFSTDHGSFKSHSILTGYILELDDELIQIYQAKKQNTFMWLQTEIKQMVKERSANLPTAKISIDLNKLGKNARNIIPLITKNDVWKLEIYVISNREDIEIRHINTRTSGIGTTVITGINSRDYEIHLEVDWLMISKSGGSPKILEMFEFVRKGKPNNVLIGKEDLKNFLEICFRFHMTRAAVDSVTIFKIEDEYQPIAALNFFPQLICAFLLQKKIEMIPVTLIISCLLKSLDDKAIGELAFQLLSEFILKFIQPDVEISEIIKVLQIASTAAITSKWSGDVTELFSNHLKILTVNEKVDHAIGIFTDLRCTIYEEFEGILNDHENKIKPYILSCVQFEAIPDSNESIFKAKVGKTQLRVGDFILFRTEKPSSNHSEYISPSLCGIVKSNDKFEMKFEISSLVPSEFTYSDWRGWYLGNVTTNFAMFTALCVEQFLTPGLIQDPQSEILPKIENVNESQYRAIQVALANRITLIWGPPAVGKTHTILALLKELIKKKERILVTASTHQAVDNILLKLDQDPGDVDLPRVHRFSDKERVTPSLLKYVLETDPQSPGQLTHCNTLIAVVKAKTRYVLVGDDKQLQATVHEFSKNFNFQRSLFENLKDEKSVPCEMLNIQHRMHPSLIKFSSSMFYDDKINSAPDVIEIPPFKTYPWESKKYSAFIGTDGRETRVFGTSYKNETQSQIIINVIKNLIDSGEVVASEIGVLSGYKGQVECITSMLKVTKIAGKEKIDVRSVDGFQGQEREVIIFSAVRSNFSLGFLKDHRRMNVMLTRAKRGLLVVGHKETLLKDERWKKWLDLLI